MTFSRQGCIKCNGRIVNVNHSRTFIDYFKARSLKSWENLLQATELSVECKNETE